MEVVRNPLPHIREAEKTNRLELGTAPGSFGSPSRGKCNRDNSEAATQIPSHPFPQPFSGPGPALITPLTYTSLHPKLARRLNSTTTHLHLYSKQLQPLVARA
jgi:hypothetical protein